ncbi:hypothetical protein C8R45DRAFT_1001976 [Mycena sanguinolenta]|nr:hypothetical protein C8R45DRAFT_1001976 [Mycena sanguinolenta]
MSSDSSSAAFPLELEREIFETTTYMYPESMDTLVFVCQRAYEWVTRIKYNTVVTTPSKNLYSCPFHVLRRGIQSNSKPASFFRDRVRHLFIPRGNTDELREMLSACRDIYTLAISPRVESKVFRDLVALLRPRYLSIRLVPLVNNVDLCRPMFTLVTHLHLFDFMPIGSGANMDHWLSFLASLPSLTHLAVIVAVREASELFASCQKLEVLVHLHSSWGPFPPDYQDLTFVDDPRFVYINVDWEYADDWVAGINGGMDFWARADAFVAMKRHGEIKPSSRCWIQAADGI